MVAAGLPTIQVLLDNGVGGFPYDITSRVRLADGIKISRGREDEQSDVTPGQCSLTLENADGGVTLGSTVIASPSPITVDNRLRVKYTTNATTFNRHTGSLSSLPVGWPTGGDLESRVSVTVTDAQARTERRVLRSVIEEEYLADSPIGLYTLGEESLATSAGDTSGAQQPNLSPSGSGAAVTFGTATGPTADGRTAAQFAGGQRLANNLTFSVAPTALSVAFFFSATTAGSLLQISSLSVPGSYISVIVDSGGVIRLGYTPGAATISTSTVNGLDGLIHHVEIQLTTTTMVLYVDGAAIGSPSVIGSPPLGASINLDVGGFRLNVDGTSPGFAAAGTIFTGVIAQVAMFASALSGTRVLAHANAGLNGFASETGAARLTRLSGYVGIPTGTIDTGLTVVPAQQTLDESAADAIRDVAKAEMGTTYVDGTGNLAFHNRTKAVSKNTPDATFAAEFLSEDTSFAVDTQGVINYFETTSTVTGVTQVVRNTVSELGDGTVTHPGHGRYASSASYLVSTDQEALDRANWIVTKHAEPQPRVGTLTLDLLTMTAAQQAAALGLEADSWVRITGLPSQAPTGTTGDFIVQGIAADTLTHTSWTLALNVVSHTLFTALILDDPTYGALDSYPLYF